MLELYLSALKTIKVDFLTAFSLGLHVTTFTQNEDLAFEQFLSLNTYVKLK